jgi:hypothetical protein
MLSDSERISIIVETLNKEIESYTPWASRKEIAAWTAIAFYLALVWLFVDFLLKISLEKLIIFKSFIEIIPLFILLIFVSIIFLIFIHSQFSSIYDKSSRTNAIRNTIFKILSNKNEPIDLDVDKDENILKIILPELEYQKEWIRPSSGFHPLNVLFDLWSFRWARKREDRKYNTHARQEAAIYSLIIFSWALLLILLLKIY